MQLMPRFGAIRQLGSRASRFPVRFLLQLGLLCGCRQEVIISSQFPEIAIDPPAPLDFGPIVVGEASSADLYVTNAGLADLLVSFSLDPSDPAVYTLGGITLSASSC